MHLTRGDLRAIMRIVKRRFVPVTVLASGIGIAISACSGKHREFVSGSDERAAQPEAGAVGASDLPTAMNGRDADAPLSSDSEFSAVQPSAPSAAVGDACTGTATACSGQAQLLQCANGRFQESTQCESICRTEAGEARCSGVCRPDSRGCSVEGNPQFCDFDGNWQNDSPCDLQSPTCVEGVCVLCQPGELRCNDDGTPQVCAADGLTWQMAGACEASAPFCVPETGQCGQCSPGSRRACIDALGNCAAGQQSCLADATWGACSILPAPEDSCIPGDDANCDGNPNTGCTCTGDVACGPEQDRGICRRGLSVCTNGVPGTCQGALNRAARDCASPFDNDCDGVPDNTSDAVCQCDPGDVESCDAQPGQDGIGICRAGSRRCVIAAGGLASQWGPCQGAVAARPRDCRSSLDNNCDGLADNTLDAACQCVPGERRDCGADPGSFNCTRGTQVCQASNGGAQSRWGECAYAPVANATACSDQDPSTVNDSCQAGRCVGTNTGLLAVGDYGSCAVRAGGAVYCWGDLAVFGTGEPALPPTRVALPGPARSVSVGYLNACAVLTSGSPFCWGTNDVGEVGNGTSVIAAIPVAPVGLETAQDVQVGFLQAAGLDRAGVPFVWGIFSDSNGDYGQPELFGGQLPPTEPHLPGQQSPWTIVTTPFRVVGVTGTTQLALGSQHACVLLTNGQVMCWGSNTAAQLGTSASGASSNPLVVAGLSDVTYLDAGTSFTCATRASGNVSCWGALNRITPVTGQAPTAVPNLDDAVQVSVEGSSSCALRRNGSVVCWGANDSGQLGNAEGVESPVPVLVSGLSDVVALARTAPLADHFCALRRNGDVACWGSNFYGTLGDGTTQNRTSPVTVVSLPN